MPKVVQHSDSVNARVFGQSVRNLRRVRGWSIDSLAKRAGVANHTIHRIERGFPSTYTIQNRIALALDTVVARLEMVVDSSRHDVAVHTREHDHWLGLIDRRSMVPEDNDDVIQSQPERSRLGRLGFVSQFVKILGCRLPTGKLISGILEIYGDLPASCYLGGEIFAFALKGDTVLNHDGAGFLLRQGEATTFDCAKPFSFSKSVDASDSTDPNLVLYVRLDETEPINSRKRKSGRVAEGHPGAWVDPENSFQNIGKKDQKLNS
jgi:transcriptional regulator with XRE-family HTH domain